MSVNEKIRLIREAKGLTQEEAAEKLKMSVNGYGDIERGITDIKVSKLENIAEMLDIKLSELFELTENGSLNVDFSGCQQNKGKNKNNFYMNSSAVELEKQLLVNELKDKELAMQQREIAYLKELNELLKSKTGND
jgi:transcriptional regulator with XRE-family HTH domain